MQHLKQAVRFISMQKRFWQVFGFFPAAVLVSACLGVALFLVVHLLDAQDTKLTNAMVLLQQNTPPGKRIAYGQDPFQFGELRLPDISTKSPVAILCTAVAGRPNSKFPQKQPRSTSSGRYLRLWRKSESPRGMSSIAG
jgi:hypothetical protein